MPATQGWCDVWERRDVLEILNKAGSRDYMWGGGTDWPEAPGGRTGHNSVKPGERLLGGGSSVPHCASLIALGKWD